jgi:hypothetical protein
MIALLAVPAMCSAQQPVSHEVELEWVEIGTDWGWTGPRPASDLHGVLSVTTLQGDQPVATDVTGHGPVDGNTPYWTSESLQGRGDGRFSPSTPFVRHRFAHGGRFVAVSSDMGPGPNNRLQIRVALGVPTWFTEIPYTPDCIDKVLRSARDFVIGKWTTAWMGDVGNWLNPIAWLLGESDPKTVMVPCWGVMRDDTITLAGDRLFNVGEILVGGATQSVPPGLVSTGELQAYGCPELRVRYGLRIQIRSSAFFPTVEPKPCELRPVVVAGSNSGTFSHRGGHLWGDRGERERNEINVDISQTSQPPAERYYPSASERTRSGTSLEHANPEIPPTVEKVNRFRRNQYEGYFLPRNFVKPISPGCSHFTNLDENPSLMRMSLSVSNLSLWWSALSLLGVRESASAIASPFGVDRPNKAPPFRFILNSERDLELASFLYPIAKSGAAIHVGDVLIAGDGIVHAPLSAAGRRLLDGLTHHHATTLVIDAGTALYLYGEFLGNQLLNYRVRYVRTDEAGNAVTDIMLLPTYEPPR